MKPLILTISISLFLFSCVSSKKYKEAQAKYDQLNVTMTGELNKCNDEKASLASQKQKLESDYSNLQTENAQLNKQIDLLKETNTTVLKQLQDLSVVSASQAESIKKSLDNIGAKDLYIQDLQAAMAKKDSLNMALVMNLKGAIGN